jgi:hypothetical protein
MRQVKNRGVLITVFSADENVEEFSTNRQSARAYYMARTYSV